MIVTVITDRDTDTEICVECSKCDFMEFFDPRPWHCCGDCMGARVSDCIRKCPKCGDDSPTVGAVGFFNNDEREDASKWLTICTTVEAEVYAKYVASDFDRETIRGMLK